MEMGWSGWAVGEDGDGDGFEGGAVGGDGEGLEWTGCEWRWRWVLGGWAKSRDGFGWTGNLGRGKGKGGR